MLLEHVGIGRTDYNTALLETVLGGADNQLATQNIDQVVIAGLGCGQCIRTQIFHVKSGDVTERQQALQVIVFINDRDCMNIVIIHVFPCAAQGQICTDTGYITVLHIGQARVERSQITRRLHLEMIKDKLRFRVDLPRTAGNMLLAGQNLL